MHSNSIKMLRSIKDMVVVWELIDNKYSDLKIERNGPLKHEFVSRVPLFMDSESSFSCIVYLKQISSFLSCKWDTNFKLIILVM